MLFSILQVDPAATVAEAAPQVVEQSYSLIEMCLKGGWLMLVLLLLSIVAIYIFGQKLWMTIRANKNNVYFMREIGDKLQSNKRRNAMDYCDIAGTPLSATIKRVTGLTVTSYINRHAVPILKKYLDDERLSLSRISELMNFSSLSYFSRYCAKHLGKSPSEYRLSIQPKRKS